MKVRSSPAMIGRTVEFHHVFWKVTGVAEDGDLLLERAHFADQPPQKGRLLKRLFPKAVLYPTMEEVRARYPRLIRALRWACLLTEGEAVNCLHGYSTTGAHYLGSEAVAHVGGAGRALEHAIRCRRPAMKAYAAP